MPRSSTEDRRQPHPAGAGALARVGAHDAPTRAAHRHSALHFDSAPSEPRSAPVMAIADPGPGAWQTAPHPEPGARPAPVATLWRIDASAPPGFAARASLPAGRGPRLWLVRSRRPSPGVRAPVPPGQAPRPARRSPDAPLCRRLRHSSAGAAPGGPRSLAARMPSLDAGVGDPARRSPGASCSRPCTPAVQPTPVRDGLSILCHFVQSLTRKRLTCLGHLAGDRVDPDDGESFGVEDAHEQLLLIPVLEDLRHPDLC